MIIGVNPRVMLAWMLKCELWKFGTLELWLAYTDFFPLLIIASSVLKLISCTLHTGLCLQLLAQNLNQY